MELKSSTGDRFEEFIAQLVNGIAKPIEEEIEAYVVVRKLKFLNITVM